MASPDLLLNIKMLDETEQNLSSILKEFKNAEKFSDEVAAATGHDHLADKVHDFASNWNAHREGMIEAIQTLHDSVKKIYDAFDETDKSLADAITSKSTQPVVK
ncbi:hypothetical protein [Parafrigoribacterium soli]|uniref:hypothetical protein n=1 Tax=Parafrigoribacterium soli TaxID=3144663 RepID=UPI0032EEEBBE